MQTLFIGKHLIFLPEVDSTNTYAMNLLRNVNATEGTVVYTDNQLKGKGQRGAIWDSEIGSNLIFSCILKPNFLEIKNTFYLSKISALAVFDLLTELLISSQYDIKIKWPNDILVNQKKIAGILIENNLHQQFIQHSVLGIGININQTKFENLQTTATSLKLITNQEFDKKNILEKLSQKLEKWYLKLKALKLEEIDEFYVSRLFGFNQLCRFSDLQNHTFEATIVGITLEGKLKLKLINNQLCYFDIREVKMIF
jgi:BirA family biotin operon repressor/biotin-[acetyl-CoA-carboxylase] ligase